MIRLKIFDLPPEASELAQKIEDTLSSMVGHAVNAIVDYKGGKGIKQMEINVENMKRRKKAAKKNLEILINEVIDSVLLEYSPALGMTGIPAVVAQGTEDLGIMNRVGLSRPEKVKASQDIAKKIVGNQASLFAQQAQIATDNKNPKWILDFARRPKVALGSFKLGSVEIGAQQINFDNKVSLSGAQLVVNKGMLQGLVLRADVGDPKRGGIKTTNYYLRTPSIPLGDGMDAQFSMSAPELSKKIITKPPIGQAGGAINIGALNLNGTVNWDPGGLTQFAANIAGRIAISNNAELTVGAGVAQGTRNYDRRVERPGMKPVTQNVRGFTPANVTGNVEIKGTFE